MSGATFLALERALADERLFDEGVEAARNACVAGASIAAAAITAAAWYDNPLTGLPALRACMESLRDVPLDVAAWQSALAPRRYDWEPDRDQVPGFGFVNETQASVIVDCLRLLTSTAGAQGRTRAHFFLAHHDAICAASGPLNHAGLAALAFLDCGTDLDEAERLFLSWRIATAIREAQRARHFGLAQFPFFTESHAYEGSWPPPRTFSYSDLLREVGLE